MAFANCERLSDAGCSRIANAGSTEWRLNSIARGAHIGGNEAIIVVAGKKE